MNAKQFVLGIVLFVVFWAFQAGYASPLGMHAWFVGSIIFVILLWAIGKAVMPKKPPADVQQFWIFVSVFALAVSFFASYLAVPLGAVLPPGVPLSAFTPLLLSIWLIVFGAALVVGGMNSKNSMQTWVGIFWLFSSVHFIAPGIGPNAYLHFAVVTGIPAIVGGLVAKK